MRKLILMAALLPLCFANVAHANECKTQQQVVDAVVQGSAGAGFEVKVHAVITGEALPPLVKLINDAPPVSDFDADLAVVFEAQDPQGHKDPRNLVVLFKSGCRIGNMMVPTSAYDAAVGNPA